MSLTGFFVDKYLYAKKSFVDKCLKNKLFLLKKFSIIALKFMSLIISDEFMAEYQVSEQEIKLDLAVSLYVKGKMNIVKAAQFTEMTKMEFQRYLLDRNIPIKLNLRPTLR